MNENLKDANILVVDDQDSNVEILADFLEFEGYTNVKTVTDSRQVLPLMESFPPDLILLDLQMPHVTGFDILEQIRRGQNPDELLPILVLTADITAESKKRALSGGASDFLNKPFDLVEVGLRIENLLFSRYLYQQLQRQNRSLEEVVQERTLELQQLNSDLEARVAQRTVQLEAANKELEAFSYSVSHDLRAPLRHILGFIGFLKDLPVERSEEELHFLKLISKGADDMARLIDALLTFSRLSRAEFRKTRINSAEVVDQVIHFFESEMQTRKITFLIGPLEDCEGDDQLIKQVWMNLISNAVKYTGKKPEAIIEVGCTRKQREIIYFVKDNGTGFDMQYAGKLFGVFQRLHSQTEFEGVGIGLANVRRIVARHGGSCSAESGPGQGATFYFSIPA